MLTAFIVWAGVGAVFIVLALYCLTAQKPCGFWANVKTEPVEDVRGYNRAMALLWSVYGLVFTLLGLPLLAEEFLPFTMFLPVAVMAETIAAMLLYTQKIDKKFRRGKKK